MDYTQQIVYCQDIIQHFVDFLFFCYIIMSTKSEVIDMSKVTVGEKLREARIAKGLTQAEVAKTLGISPQAISNFEREKCRVSNENLRALCDIYGISADWVLNISKVVSFRGVGKDGRPIIKTEYAIIPPWVKDSMKFADGLHAKLETTPPEKRISVIAKTLEEINPTEVEFFLAEKEYQHDQRDKEILDIISDALPDKLILRIQNIKTALIATVNVQEGKIPFKK